MNIKTITKLLLYTVLITVVATGCSFADPGNKVPDLFGIYTAALNGTDVRLIVSNPKQQMTHPRVSPDWKWITFTRYTKKNWAGLAMEKGGYKGTEIMLVRMDGSDMQTIIPAKKGILNCNSGWTKDGKSLVWLTTDNPKRQPQLMIINLETRKITRVPTPSHLKTADPHIESNKIVFPVIGDDLNSIWIMGLHGKNPRRLSYPKYGKKFPKSKHFPGDYDPKLSPGGKKVAFMRLFGKVGWKIFVVDVETGKEKNLSGPNNIDALPDWSSDGKLLLFWHINKKQPRKMGIYTMMPDGSNRRIVPLPRRYLHGHPHFFPNSGSSKDARIIYQATRAPKLP